MESLRRRVEAVIAAKGPTSYLSLWIKNGTSLKFICESKQVSDTFGNIVHVPCEKWSWQVGLGIMA